MKLKNLFVIHAVVALVNGAGLIAAPGPYLGLFGVSVSGADALLVARLLGAALLTYCFVAWLARDADDSVARQAIVLGFFLTAVIGFVIVLIAQLSGVLNALGWLVVAIYLWFDRFRVWSLLLR